LTEAQEKKYGLDPEVDDSKMLTLALLLNLQGKHPEAEVLLRRVIALREGSMGMCDSRTLKSFNALGEALTAQNQLEEAAGLYRKILEKYDTYDDRAREEALKSADNLAQVLCKQGDLKGAEETGRCMISRREDLLGMDHIDTLVGVHTLAEVMAARGRHEEAITLFQQAYCGTAKRVGRQHPDAVEFLEDFNNAVGR
jgi:tetratricopeptide (TPR) repeat protein